MQSNKNVLLKAKEHQSREALADFLTGLAEQIRSGEVKLVQADTDTTLAIPQSVRMDIEVVEEEKRRGTKRELEIELSWYDGEQGGAHSPLTLG